MNEKRIEIVLLQDTDIPEVNAFYNSTYNVNRSEADFRWEFYDAPAGKAIYVLAKDADTKQIVGTQCAIPIELITGTGEIILSAKSEDTLVHPDYRGLNIFENMYERLFAACRNHGIKYIWGFTPAKKPFLKLGFEIPYAHSQSLMALNIQTSYQYISGLNLKNNFTSKFKIFVLCMISRLKACKQWFISDKLLHGVKYNLNEKKDIADNNALMNLQGGAFAIKEDLTFLNWRIVSNKHHEKLYNICFSDARGKIASITFNHHKNGVWYLINDIYTNGIDQDKKTSLLSKAIKILIKQEKNNLKLIRTWDFEHNENAKEEIVVRKKNGFIHLDKGISFVWKSLDDNETLDVNNFNLSRMATQGVI